MTFSWTKLVPLSKIQFAFLILVFFYQIHSPSWLTFLLSLSLICLLVKRLSKKEFLGVFAILSFCALFLLYQKQQLVQKLEIQPVQITSVALVPDSIRINGDQLAVLGRHGKHSYQLFYRLKSQAEAQLFKKEHRWLVMHAKVTLEKAEEVRNFKGFNYQTFLTYQGIYRIGKVEQIEQLEVISPESICDYLSSLRRRAIVHCQQHFPRPMSHYLTGLLFGYLDKSFGEMTDYYSQLGIIHLFALSGMQVGFFLTCFRRVLLLLAVPLEWIKWIELPFACFYAALTLLSVKYPLTNEVTFIDIGQGDSILVREWTGKNLLIDVGGRPFFSSKEHWRRGHHVANAQKTLIPYLKSRGIHTIDQLLVTHADTDHMGDIEVVAKAIRIKEILTSQGSLSHPSFVRRLRRLKCHVRVLAAGDQLPIMGSVLQVLYPWQLGDGKNNDSLVLYGRLLNRTFLFTGDLEKEGENEIIKRYPQLRVDYLKAGHHGSNTSSSAAFLDHIQPKVAFISAGKNNRYQHPHRETLARLEDRQITYYRTDTQGAIRLTGRTSWHLETVR